MHTSPFRQVGPGLFRSAPGPAVALAEPASGRAQKPSTLPLYPAVMDGKREPAVEPGGSETSRGSAGPGGGAEASPPPSESFGPLAVTRLRKDDGRWLLVFARAGEAEP